jgi:uncharacterized protein (TIGR04222 family)
MPASHTWGISGPTFLTLYLLAAGALVVFTVWYRLAGRGRGDDPRGGDAAGAALSYLTGGPRRAVGASVGALHVFGAVDTDPAGTLVVTGPVPAGASRLDHAVHDAAGRGTSASRLADDPGVATALEAIRQELVRAGWLRDERTRTLARLGAWLLLALAAVGMVRTAAGASAGRPVGYLVLSVGAIVVIGLILLPVPHTTLAGKLAVERTRGHNSHLAPGQNPAWATYGIGALTLGVGLYGTAALWAADPAFADAAGLEQAEAARRAATGGGGAGADGGSGGGGGCGGGCGGGGCGCGG